MRRCLERMGGRVGPAPRDGERLPTLPRRGGLSLSLLQRWRGAEQRSNPRTRDRRRVNPRVFVSILMSIILMSILMCARVVVVAARVGHVRVCIIATVVLVHVRAAVSVVQVSIGGACIVRGGRIYVHTFAIMVDPSRRQEAGCHKAKNVQTHCPQLRNMRVLLVF